MLQHKLLASVDLDDSARMHVHAEILEQKPILKEVFTEFHTTMLRLDRKHLAQTGGMKIELGAGVFPIKRTFDDVLATDVVASPDTDLVLDALAMDLPDESVHALYGQNCFHHFPDPDRFFKEALRVLKPGGGVVLIDPYHGPLASFVYRRLFTTETFVKDADNWQTDMAGPMVGANQALSYVVFVRGRDEFDRRHGGLDVVEMKPLSSYVRYLLSGGLNFVKLVPDFAAGALKAAEWALRPGLSLLGLHQVIVLKKQS
ncbi:MAG: methyltransferase domain-containing protein [Acidobacteria bacterium]|nr:methyltransferase domain-containing protein [Acidobacteriota bacterium]